MGYMKIGIEHHAVLYALLVQAACSVLGEPEGRRHMAAVTRAYGIQRGKRMAANADRNGDLRDMDAFFIYGEWKGEEGENLSSLVCADSCTVSTVRKCAWYDAWIRHGLAGYGTLYCRYVDAALAEGFGGSFTLDVQQAIGKGDETCIFRWNRPYDADKVMARKQADHERYILPFSFHCRELLETAETYFCTHCPEQAEQILSRTKQEYQRIFHMEVPL